VLVVNKPPGWNTHLPSPYAGEGIYDWLKHRDPRWGSLAIIHRLDKETSGVMVFGKSPLANRSLTEQFTGRTVQKKYQLLSDQPPRNERFTVRSRTQRAGDRYVSGRTGEEAETRFCVQRQDEAGRVWIQAQPLTGRTHQIRVHAAENGFPIIGDTLYGGARSNRLCLHASSLEFCHPVTQQRLVFSVPADFTCDAGDALREAFIESDLTNAFRLRHGAADGLQFRGCYVDRLGDFLLCSSKAEPGRLTDTLSWLQQKYALPGVYHRELRHDVQRVASGEASARLLKGEAAPERFTIHENEVKFELSFNEGYSVGLFLDQRDNRRRLLVNHVAATFPLFPEGATGREVLNLFAYTCGFSVCAALGCARTTSLDLSRSYLEWGQRNFALNGLDPARHDFIYGDALDWLRRLAKKGKKFDAVLLDPPTFSQSKERGVFRAERDYGGLVAAALRVLKPNGVLFASTNAAGWNPGKFLARIEEPVRLARRRILQHHYVPQPPDFPISRGEPAYLKSAWLRIE